MLFNTAGCYCAMASVMNYVKFLTENRILNVAIISWFVAQLVKIIIELVVHKTFDFTRIMGSGGMPSSHAACTVGLAAATCKVCGHTSPEFAITCIFAFIVMYDAFNVRRSAGEQAKILNYILRNWKEITPDIFGKELKELLGHTPFQVFVGALLGLAIGVIL